MEGIKKVGSRVILYSIFN